MATMRLPKNMPKAFSMNWKVSHWIDYYSVVSLNPISQKARYWTWLVEKGATVGIWPKKDTRLLGLTIRRSIVEAPTEKGTITPTRGLKYKSKALIVSNLSPWQLTGAAMQGREEISWDRIRRSKCSPPDDLSQTNNKVEAKEEPFQ